MADNTHIEWTDATWQIVTGCSVVSPGCTNCYAMRLAGTRLRDHPSRQGLTTESKAGPVWNGQVRFNGGWLDQPLRWRRPRRIFVCAHSDLFHEAVPDEWIDQVFAVMALAPRHTFQCLTKRPKRMREYLLNPWTRVNIGDRAGNVSADGDNDQDAVVNGPWPLPNVWLGVSVEDQTRANERIPILLDTPAAVRWISAEPLLGPVSLHSKPCLELGSTATCPICLPQGFGAAIDWVVAGGESGPGARPMHPDWVRQIRDDCAAAGVAFLFKQWGEWIDADQPGVDMLGSETSPMHDWHDGHYSVRVGKRAAAKILRGEA